MRWDEIHPPPIGIGSSNYLTAVVTLDQRLIEILDVERVPAEIVGIDDHVSARLCEDQTSVKSRPRHVFVADDSMVARKQITKVLDQIGFTYDIAENGRAAWDTLKAAAAEQPILGKYGMVISDIEMPEMDGYTLTKMIALVPISWCPSLLPMIWRRWCARLCWAIEFERVPCVRSQGRVSVFCRSEFIRTLLSRALIQHATIRQ